MKQEKSRELFLKEQGTLKEQERQLNLLWLNKENGQHPFFKVSNSKRIKNKIRRKQK
jgi:hypothetical protein